MKNQNTLLILLALTMIVLLLSSFLLNIYIMLGCELIALSIISLLIYSLKTKN
jgi:hypothetical protein